MALIVADYRTTLGRVPDDSISYAILKSLVHKRAAERLLRLFEANGGVYIKAGQHIASLSYLLPSEYTETLKVLQDSAPRSTYEQVNDVISRELGRPIEELYGSGRVCIALSC